MADGTVIQVEDVQVNGQSGHITLKVKSVTTRTVNGTVQTHFGPTRSYGVDAASFHARFQGSVEQLKAWVRSQHTCYAGVHATLVEELGKLKGQTI
jgi:hypothetical protein